MLHNIIMRSLLFLAFSSFGTAVAASSYGNNQERFAIYYSDKAAIEKFSNYQLMVLDRLYHPSLQELSEDGKMLLGYLSLGEIERSSPYFQVLKQSNLILQENKNWKGSYYIDLRDSLWQKIVIEEIIPDMLRQGFKGIFFDTLDNPLELERVSPVKFKGMSDAAVQLVKAVRMHYPQIKIMVNRAYPILPQIAFDVDMVLGESVAGDYNFDKKIYMPVEKSLYRQQVQWLQEVKKMNPLLQIYTLDYAEPNDKKTIADIYRIQRENGFIPYVASIELDELIDEPELIKESVLQ
jgi:uncharacterized protein (TIGR01370 family)